MCSILRLSASFGAVSTSRFSLAIMETAERNELRKIRSIRAERRPTEQIRRMMELRRTEVSERPPEEIRPQPKRKP